MSEQQLVSEQADAPRYRSLELGRPIPDSPDAVSVCLPTLDSVIGYEEGDAAIVTALAGGYPRFVLHSQVQELIASFKDMFPEYADHVVLPFPSFDAAIECSQFCAAGGMFKNEEILLQEKPVILPFTANNPNAPAVYMLAVPGDPSATEAARAYWQHTGRIVSSRHARALLTAGEAIHEKGAYAEEVQKQTVYDLLVRTDLANHSGLPVESIFLYPTGMAAVYDAFDVVRTLNINSVRENQPTVQFGFPYVDTDKIQSRSENGRYLLSAGGEADIQHLRELVQAEKVSAVFTELPGNPLLTTPDIKAISSILRPAGIPLVVDETLGTFANVDVAPYADIIVTSLTKYYSGSGTVMGGALLISNQSPLAAELLQIVKDGYENECYSADLNVLSERGGALFSDRMKQINENAQALAEMLAADRRVATVHYPSQSTSKDSYEAVRKTSGGYGGLLSIELQNADAATPIFYDALELCKGPSLGTEFTLICPYTLLAHYRELPEVAKAGVSKNLIRVSVGSLESIETLTAAFKNALEITERVLSQQLR